MADIVLVQSVVGAWDKIKSAPALPLSLLSAARYAEKKYKVKIIDQRLDANWKNNLKHELNDAILFGTTAMCGPQILSAIEVSRFVKENSDVPIVWGGKHASLTTNQTLENPNIDIVVIGDGEHALVELADTISKDKNLNKVKGIAYKDKNGNVKFTEERQLIDINELPEVPYHLVNIKNYLPEWQGIPTLHVETSRGCPYGCRFCHNTLYDWRWRSLRAEKTIERIENLHDKHNIKSIWFVDDDFFVDLERSEKIIKKLLELDMVYTIQGTAVRSVSRMNDDYFNLLEKSGCGQLNLGIESGSEKILKLVDKKLTLQEVTDLNKRLSKYNIIPWWYFMCGFPTETVDDLKKTVNLALKILEDNPHARISPFACFTPYPSTSMFDLAIKYGFKPPKKLEDWAEFATDNVNTPWLRGKMYQVIRNLQFTSLFVDKKAEDVVKSRFLKVLAKIYRPVARHHFSHVVGRFMPERQIGFKMRDLMEK